MNKLYILFTILTFVLYSCDNSRFDNNKETEQPEKNDGKQTINVHRKYLIEDVTGAWCGYCIGASETIEKTNKNIFIPVTIHSRDKFDNKYAKTITRLLRVNSFPSIFINRKRHSNWGKPILKPRTNTTSKIAISIDSEIKNDNVEIVIKMKFDNKYKSSSLKYVIYLLENKLIGSQANYLYATKSSKYYKKPKVIMNFEHNHVLRKIIGGVGIQIKTELINSKGSIVGKHSINITRFNKKNCEIVVFIFDAKSRFKRIINVQNVKVGEAIKFHKIIK